MPPIPYNWGMQAIAIIKDKARTLWEEHADGWLAIGVFLVAFFAYRFLNHGKFADLHYFVPLADAFLHGRLHLLEHPSWLNELVPFQGKYYVVYPPMPALLTVPFLFLWGPGLNQAFLSTIIGALSIFLVSLILRNWGFSRPKTVLFSLFFAFGTIHWFGAQNGTSWHFAQICAVFFLLLAILETQEEKRPWLLGFYLGCAALSRLPTLLAFPFFVFFLHGERKATFWKDLLAFGGVLSAFMGAYLWYNWARFGNPLTTGYTLIPGLMQEYQYRHGFFALQNLPRNLYAFLLKTPNFVENCPFLKPTRLGGLSILLTTPLFLWALKARDRAWSTRGAWLSIALISFLIFLHADPGGEQFGYRYALDFYPFLFLLTMKTVKDDISPEQWGALLLGFLVNAWGMWSYFTNWLD